MIKGGNRQSQDNNLNRERDLILLDQVLIDTQYSVE